MSDTDLWTIADLSRNIALLHTAIMILTQVYDLPDEKTTQALQDYRTNLYVMANDLDDRRREIIKTMEAE
ncbi:MAG: hypothetical protein IJ592_03445, partial [Candidatus Methanomethylophilaceae archaeon]|nr:hypothetical protein [Candidatus Methanomethylophilaceae archaeon]